MTWIRTIAPPDASGRLGKLYGYLTSAKGHVDHILQALSLRPRTLEGHMALYRAVMRSEPHALSLRERELVAAVVSRVNGCDYCLDHHVAGLARHLQDESLALELVDACTGARTSPAPTERERAMAAYAVRLTRTPEQVVEGDVEALRAAGFDDVAILDLNQVVAYFAYANRLAQGLGVRTEGEPLGHSALADEPEA